MKKNKRIILITLLAVFIVLLIFFTCIRIIISSNSSSICKYDKLEDLLSKYQLNLNEHYSKGEEIIGLVGVPVIYECDYKRYLGGNISVIVESFDDIDKMNEEVNLYKDFYTDEYLNIVENDSYLVIINSYEIEKYLIKYDNMLIYISFISDNINNKKIYNDIVKYIECD